LAGLSFWLASTSGVSARRGARVLGGVIAAVGAATLLEYALDVPLGIDQILFADPDAVSNPGRPPFLAAAALLCAGFALLALEHWSPAVRAISVAARGLGSFAAFIVLIDYSYNFEGALSFAPVSSVAIHAALGFAVLFVGLDLLQPDQSISGIVFGERAQ